LCVICVENVVDVARDVNSDEDDGGGGACACASVFVDSSLLSPALHCFSCCFFLLAVIFSTSYIHQRILKVWILGCKLCKVTRLLMQSTKLDMQI
jgi:hypothetical protein